MMRPTPFTLRNNIHRPVSDTSYIPAITDKTTDKSTACYFPGGIAICDLSGTIIFA
jgi:hypothetical protein